MFNSRLQECLCTDIEMHSGIPEFILPQGEHNTTNQTFMTYQMWQFWQKCIFYKWCNTKSIQNDLKSMAITFQNPILNGFGCLWCVLLVHPLQASECLFLLRGSMTPTTKHSLHIKGVTNAFFTNDVTNTRSKWIWNMWYQCLQDFTIKVRMVLVSYYMYRYCIHTPSFPKLNSHLHRFHVIHCVPESLIDLSPFK